MFISARVLLLLGNIFEWFDFVLFAFLTPVMAKQFFPVNQNPAYSTMMVLMVFAIGFLGRPIGGLIFGLIGDRCGRKHAFAFSLFLMGIPSLLIALLPTYQSMGFLAPLCLTLLRLLQGVSCGGSFTSSLVYLSELSQINVLRNINIAWYGSLLGTLLSSILIFSLNHYASYQWLALHGWRYLFFVSGLLALLGGIMRRYLPSSPQFSSLDTVNKISLLGILVQEGKRLLKIGLLAISVGVISYVDIVFLPTYLFHQNQLGFSQITQFSALNTVGIMLAIALVGFCSKRLSHVRIFKCGMCFAVIFAFPAFIAFQHHGLVLGAVLLIVPFACIASAGTTLICLTITNVSLRCTAVSVSYNLFIAVFGGMTPFLCSLLTFKLGPLGPAVWLAGSMVIVWIFLRKALF